MRGSKIGKWKKTTLSEGKGHATFWCLHLYLDAYTFDAYTLDAYTRALTPIMCVHFFDQFQKLNWMTIVPQISWNLRF